MLPIIFLSLAISAGAEVRNLYEKTYPRDNTFCLLSGRKVEVQLRGVNKLIDPGEEKIGQVAFFKNKARQYFPLELGNASSGSFRFFRKSGASLCSKSAGFRLDADHLAILFEKENHPFRGQLVVQTFNIKNMEATELRETGVSASQAEPIAPYGFAFNSIPERPQVQSGDISIAGSTYHFQDRELVLWYKFGPNPTLLPTLVYDKFPWKHLLKDQQEFLNSTGWDAKEDKFKSPKFYIAVNHNEKKECLLFSSETTRPNGSEAWLCGSMQARVD
jgi:hypothetical protein